MHRYPPPEIHELLLPVIACLPTAFFSPKAPPALISLLSPILRQRVALLSAASQSNNRSNWLSLLTWSSTRAERLQEIVSNLLLEPHPVSGELELFEDEPDGQETILYRRLDPETLQAKCDVKKHELSVVWAWCTNDTGATGPDGTDEGAVSDGWKVAEVRPLDEEADKAEEWYASQGEAEEAESASLPTSLVDKDVPRNGASPAGPDQEDNDYWASYDRTPSNQTPANKRSPAPGFAAPGARAASTDELEYFSRYGSEVQPAMDSHDPDEEEGAATFESTLRPKQNGVNGDARQDPAPIASAPPPLGIVAEDEPRIHSPQPSRPSSPHSPIERLESSATAVSAAEVGVKQHISTEMKSLYRLATAAGIEKDEFERVIRRELEVLDLLDF